MTVNRIFKRLAYYEATQPTQPYKIIQWNATRKLAGNCRMLTNSPSLSERVSLKPHELAEKYDLKPRIGSFKDKSNYAKRNGLRYHSSKG